MRTKHIWFLLCLLCFYLFASNLYWLKIDKVVEGEESPHLVRSIELYRIVIYYLLGDNPDKLEQLLNSPKDKPWNSFLFYSFVLPSYFLFGISTDVAVITTSLIHLLIAILTYLVGLKLTSKKETGLLAAYICSLYPLIFNMSRHYSPNPAFVASVLLVIYLVIESDSFGKTGLSIIAGLATGFSLLLSYTNWTFMAAGYISEALKIKEKSDRKSRIINIILSAVIAIISSLWWYLLNLKSLLSANAYIRLQFGSTSGSPEIFSIHSFVHYFTCLIYGQIYTFNTILALIGLYLFLKKVKNYRILTILWIAIPYIFFTFSYEAKNTRYTMPYLPLLAIVTANLVLSIKTEWIKKLSVGLIIFHCFAVQILSSFNIPGFPDEVSISTGSDILYKLPLYGTQVWGRIKPDPRDYKVETIVKLIYDDFEASKIAQVKSTEYCKVMFSPESPNFTPLEAGFYTKLFDIPVQITPLAINQFDYYIASFDFDYIVLRSANAMSSIRDVTRHQMERAEKALLSTPPEFSRYFTILVELPLFDDSKILILKKTVNNLLQLDNESLRMLYIEGLAVNPESPFLHYDYAQFLKGIGNIPGYVDECKLVKSSYENNQKTTGYLFLDYKEKTMDLVENCEQAK
jgi:4-amino-4-deoxy-L-arabinose transferase-like glycosyltransferase